MTKFENWLKGLSDDERIERAASKQNHIQQHLTASIYLYENNRIFVFDTDFDKRVPESFARHTFNIAKQTLVKSHFLQICKLWDKPDVDRDSLPTVGKLLDSPAVLSRQEQLQIERARSSRKIADFARNTWMIEESEKNSLKVAAERRAGLEEANDETQKLASSKLINDLRDYRDRYIAHSLSTKPVPLDLPYYGDSERLMEVTKPILSLYLKGIGASDPSWSENHMIARRYAEALWKNCQFNVAE